MKTLLPLPLLILCLSLLSGKQKAQNYREDILAVNKNLLSQKNYSLQVNYELYLDGELMQPFQQRQVKIIRQGANLYMKQNSEMEVIITKNFQFLIDHGNKLFSAMEKEASGETREQLSAEASNLLNTYVDTIVSVFEKITIVANTDEAIKYECRLKSNDQVSIIWVEIDKKLKLYRSLTTQYKQKTKVRELNNTAHRLTLTMRYKGFSASPVVAPAVFNELNYVTLKDHKLSGPAKKYSQYNYSNNSPQ